MNYEIIALPPFEREVKQLSKKYPSLKNDFKSFAERLSQNPFQGISLGKDCFKVRMAISSKNKGKSGGARVITCVKVIDTRIFLMAIYDKSSKENLSEIELDNLLKLIAEAI